MLKLKEALAEYDRTAVDRQKMWDEINCISDLHLVDRLEGEALEKVQTAFYESTKHINCVDRCKLADVPFIRWFADRQGELTPV